jgi:hypothetical protein
MKIEGSGPVRSTPVKRGDKTKGSKSSKSFAHQIESAPDTSDPISGISQVQPVDALLAIQEVEDSTAGGPNAQARKWGKDVLDRLEGIRLGLLAGGIPLSELKGIAEMVERKRTTVTDPALSELLDQIELRARVEIAKYDRSD